MKIGLRARILFIAIAVTLLSLGAVLAIGGHVFAEAYLSALQSRSIAIAQGLRLQMDRILQLGIQIEDLSGFDKQCKSVTDSYPGVDFAWVVAPEGAILFSNDPEQVGQTPTDAGFLQAVRSRSEATVEYRQEGVAGYGAVVPIITLDDAHVGSVVIGFSARVLDARKQEMYAAVLGVGLMTLLFGGIVMVFALSHFISRPLRLLISSIEQIRSDPANLNRRIPLDSADELGKLAQAFNALMGALKETTVSKSSLEAAYGALRESEEKYRELVANAHALILRLDLNGNIAFINEYAEQFFGYRSAEIVGRSVLGTIVPKVESGTGHDPGSMFSDVLADPSKLTDTENENITRDGRRVYVRWACRVILDELKQPVGILSIGHDITEQKRLEQELEHAALHDPLTGLWNRRQFQKLLEFNHTQGNRYSQSYGLMLLDVDHFKAVNDNCGHTKGDDALVLIAQALESRVRESDAVCRWGGEEFVILLPQTNLEKATHVAESMRRTIEAIQHETLPRLTVSIGVVERRPGELIEEVFRRADIALYRAKESGRNRVIALE